MNKADEFLLAALRRDVLADMPDEQWQMVTDEVEQAGGVRQVRGYAATVIQKAVMEKKSKIETVMGEFKEGKLRSSSGKKVKSRKQAIAIALSEQRRIRKEVLEKASFGGNRSDAGRYAANIRWQKQGKEYVDKKPRVAGATPPPPRPPDGGRKAANARWQKQNKGDAKPKAAKPEGISEDKAKMIRDADLSELAGMIVRDLRAQGKQMPFGAQPYIDAMRTMGEISEKYGEDSGSSIVAYALSNLRSYKGATARAIKAELNRRFKAEMKKPLQSDKGMDSSEAADSFSEDQFDRKKPALYGLKDNPTYKKGVEARKQEIKRGSDGKPRFRGTDLKAARESLKTEEDSLSAFEDGKATSRQILGSRFNKTETRAILHARVASARANVQALEEFEQENQ